MTYPEPTKVNWPALAFWLMVVGVLTLVVVYRSEPKPERKEMQRNKMTREPLVEKPEHYPSTITITQVGRGDLLWSGTDKEYTALLAGKNVREMRLTQVGEEQDITLWRGGGRACHVYVKCPLKISPAEKYPTPEEIEDQ